MKKILLGLSLVFGLTTSVFAADDNLKKDDSQLAITKPEDKVTTNHLNIFKIKTTGKSLTIKVLNNKENVETYLSPKNDAIVILFKEPGTYSFYAVTAISDALVETEFTTEVVKNENDNVTPVKPDAALVLAFQKAYDADTTEYKRKSLDALIEAMKFAVPETENKSIPNNREFAIRVSNKTKELVGSNLSGVRVEIGKYLNSALPSDTVSVLDDASRKKHKYEYQKIVDALNVVK